MQHSKPIAVIFDLDGTLCHLKSHDNRHKHNGEEIPKIVLLKYIETEYTFIPAKIIILTGRHERFRTITEQWLQKHNVTYDQVIMQQGATSLKNHIYKKEKLVELDSIYKILCVYDDNPKLEKITTDLNIPFYKC